MAAEDDEENWEKIYIKLGTTIRDANVSTVYIEGHSLGFLQLNLVNIKTGGGASAVLNCINIELSDFDIDGWFRKKKLKSWNKKVKKRWVKARGPCWKAWRR